MLTAIDWSQRAQITWDETDETNSMVRIDTVIPADPPHVATRRALWRVRTTTDRRIFRDAYQFGLLAHKVNDAIRERRGRGVVVEDIRDNSVPPLAAAAWHLSRELTEPPLVTALAPRTYSADASLVPTIDFAVVLLLDALLHIAGEHRQWALRRLVTAGKKRKRAEERLGVVCVDVQHRPELHRYLTELLPGRVSVTAQVPSGVVHVRIRP